MCGIIARIGDIKESRDILNKLKDLEYRGYDSFGVASVEIVEDSSKLNTSNDMDVIKKVGVCELSDISNYKQSVIQIAHTRWATHGGVTQENAHPHMSQKYGFYVVMNGIVENYTELKEELTYNYNYEFNSQCDTEIIVALAQKYYEELYNENETIKEGLIIEILNKIIEKLKGNFAFTLLHNSTLFMYKRGNPLAIGLHKEENQFYISSDVLSLQEYTKSYYVVEDDQLISLALKDLNIKNVKKASEKNYFDSGILELFSLNKINHKFETELSFKFEEFENKLKCIKTDTHSNYIKLQQNKKNIQILSNSLLSNFLSSKSAFMFESQKLQFSMFQEILEQIQVSNILTVNNYKNITNLAQDCKEFESIVLVGAGTSYNAAMILHYMLLDHDIYSQCIVASEFEEYLSMLVAQNKKTLVISFSQSGETADILYALTQLKEIIQEKPLQHCLSQHSNFKFVSITNTPHSTLDRISDFSVYLQCGREVAVASTKAFMHQISIAKLIDIELKYSNINYKGTRNSKKLQKKYDKHSIQISREYMQEIEYYILEYISKYYTTIVEHAQSIYAKSSVFYIGKGIFYPLVIEGALKLKEISYNNANAFAAGELKHGSLALIEEGTPVIAFSNTELMSIEECRSRGAYIIQPPVLKSVASSQDTFKHIVCHTLYLQLLAFECAYLNGNNPDRPRNLAKSVTVR